MYNRFRSRLFALICFSAAIGALLARDTWKKHLMGRASYLQFEGTRFDKHLANMSHPFLEFVSFTIFIGIFIAVYEGVVFVFTRAVGSKG